MLPAMPGAREMSLGAARHRIGARRPAAGAVLLAALAAVAVAASALADLRTLFVQPLSGGAGRRVAVSRAAAPTAKSITKIAVALNSFEGSPTQPLTISKKFGDEGKVAMAQTTLPLGLSIVKDESLDAWIIEDVLPGGSASQGLFEVQPGNVLHGITVMDGDKKMVLQVGNLETVDQLTEAILSNNDGEISLVLEAEGGGAGDSPFGWMEGVTRML